MREHPLARNVHFRLEDRAAARLGDEQRFVIRTAESHVRGVRLGAAANAIDRLSERVETARHKALRRPARGLRCRHRFRPAIVVRTGATAIGSAASGSGCC